MSSRFRYIRVVRPSCRTKLQIQLVEDKMRQDITTRVKIKTIIDAVQTTDDTLNSLGYLSLFIRFLRNGGFLTADRIGS